MLPNLFRRAPAAPAPSPQMQALGLGQVACVLQPSQTVPPGCVGVLFDGAGATRRIAAGGVCDAQPGQLACCIHPGPYQIEIAPFALAPEAGLHLTLALDLSGDDEQARFDQVLAAECAGELALDGARLAIESQLQAALAKGHLSLPPCASHTEWHSFRAGLNRLLYLRFGWLVDECLPIDLGDRIDFAAQLRARAAAATPGKAEPSLSASQSGGAHATTGLRAGRAAPPGDSIALDAPGLRRLFIELPRLGRAFRQLEQHSAAPTAGASPATRASMPPGATHPPPERSVGLRTHKLQERLARLAAHVNGMPALNLAAPGRPLAASLQSQRAAATIAALDALDESWALAARASTTGPDGMSGVLAEAERLVDALERACKQRRSVPTAPAPAQQHRRATTGDPA